MRLNLWAQGACGDNLFHYGAECKSWDSEKLCTKLFTANSSRTANSPRFFLPSFFVVTVRPLTFEQLASAAELFHPALKLHYRHKTWSPMLFHFASRRNRISYPGFTAHLDEARRGVLCGFKVGRPIDHREPFSCRPKHSRSAERRRKKKKSCCKIWKDKGILQPQRVPTKGLTPHTCHTSSVKLTSTAKWAHKTHHAFLCNTNTHLSAHRRLKESFPEPHEGAAGVIYIHKRENPIYGSITKKQTHHNHDERRRGGVLSQAQHMCELTFQDMAFWKRRPKLNRRRTRQANLHVWRRVLQFTGSGCLNAAPCARVCTEESAHKWAAVTGYLCMSKYCAGGMWGFRAWDERTCRKKARQEKNRRWNGKKFVLTTT